MAWHLKDRELEQKLIEICPDFLDCVDLAVQIKGREDNFILVEFNREKDGDELGFNCLYFWLDELEDIPEYNPKTWNEYPEMTPPENIYMRVELKNFTDKPGVLRKVGAIYKNGKWCNSTGDEFPLHYKILRFRPWED